MERMITIGDTEYRLKASALTVVQYRNTFGLDLLQEMRMLDEGKKQGEQSQAAMWTLSMFERLAYVMLDWSDKPTFEQWLESIPSLDLRKALPEIAAFWVDSTRTRSESKKKREL